MLTGEDGSRRFGYCRRLLVSTHLHFKLQSSGKQHLKTIVWTLRLPLIVLQQNWFAYSEIQKPKELKYNKTLKYLSESNRFQVLAAINENVGSFLCGSPPFKFFISHDFKQKQKYYSTANKGKCGISKHLWVTFIPWTAAYIPKVLCQHCLISLQHIWDVGKCAPTGQGGIMMAESRPPSALFQDHAIIWCLCQEVSLLRLPFSPCHQG